MEAQHLLEGLTEPQRQAVCHSEGPLLVLAGPGSGKTRVITRRAAYLAATVTAPQHILAITFTNKAANEMAERMRELRIPPGFLCCTFHSLCARLLRIYADRAGLQTNFSIFDTADQKSVMKEAIKRADLSTDNFPPGKILHLISRAKNDMIMPEEFAQMAEGFQDKKLAKAYHAYVEVLREQNALDFDDLLVKMAQLLSKDAELRNKLEDRFRYVLVDEYQDTNHAQYLIARGLALQKENLCVTGDPDQSIYGWRGANLNNILQFEEDFRNATVVSLEQNYRSTPQILQAADKVIAHNEKRKLKTLWTENPEGASIKVAECEDNRGESAYIAEQIRRHIENGGDYNGIAVFYRVNALSRSIEGALRYAHIPYQIARGVEFYNRKEIKDTLAYAKALVNPSDRVSLARIINTPTRGIGKTTVERLWAYADFNQKTVVDALMEVDDIPGVSRAARHLKSFAQLMVDLKATAEHGTVKDTIEFIIRYSGLLAMWSSADDEDAMDNVDELINAASEYDRQHADGSGSLLDWLQQISLVSDVDAVEEQSGAVTLMTLHAAKGLEFDVVFMAGVEDGLLPHERSQNDPSEMEEERRLCFVGMTRARQQLFLTSARWRDFRGISRRTARSPFLKELPKDEIEWVTVDEEGKTRYDEEDAEEEMPASALDFIHWRRGQLVRHPSFGVGRVMWIRPSGGRTHAGVHFAAYGEKTLVLEYAKLEEIEDDSILE
jgi:DNA helicase-2/ATP-dependent DNA helicase PcrA